LTTHYRRKGWGRSKAVETIKKHLDKTEAQNYKNVIAIRPAPRKVVILVRLALFDKITKADATVEKAVDGEKANDGQDELGMLKDMKQITADIVGRPVSSDEEEEEDEEDAVGVRRSKRLSRSKYRSVRPAKRSRSKAFGEPRKLMTVIRSQQKSIDKLVNALAETNRQLQRMMREHRSLVKHLVNKHD
jgi:hypothetical protein